MPKEQELNQGEATEEQPKEEISTETPEVTSPEEKETSERTYSEAEWRKMQSMKDTAETKAQRYERELQELRKREQDRILADRRRELEDLANEPEEQAKVRRKHQIEDELKILEEKREKETGAVLRKYDQALELAKEHNLSLEDARELMKAETPREMELMAQIKIAERTKPQPKSEKVTFKPDRATSDAGIDDFKSLEKKFIADPYKYGLEYKKALAKRGQ